MDSRVVIFDIECNGLNPDRIHCLSVFDKKPKHTTNYGRMKEFFSSEHIFVGHNIIRFDIPVVEKLLGVQVSNRVVDTLALSWYLFPSRKRHGLADWGEEFGVPKPKVDDWENLSVQEYIHRCNEDVRINTLLWEKQWKLLKKIYKDEESIWKFIDYLMFKMECAREQEKSKWKLDIARATEGLKELEAEKEKKVEELRNAMPKVPIIQKRKRPAKPYKKDGSYSEHGRRWFDLLIESGLPEDYNDVVEVVSDWEEPNPNSSDQIKKWLYSLGWKPETFKIIRDKNTGDVRQIPQINLEHGQGICPSIKKLFDKHPELEALEGLGVISHRIGILNGFLSSVDDEGFVIAGVQGMTNTLRFKHAVCVNLPGVGKPYGELIRGCLISRDGYELCGSDKSSLEDRLKQHYIFPYDPEYVREMQSEDYDPHLSLALQANAVTQEQILKFKSKEDMSIGGIRHTFKQGNYACQYGAGPPRLSMTADITLAEAKKIHKAYWDKNWAIKKAAEDQHVITIEGQMWLLNPINGFYYSLRYEKDRFSTLVQGSASYTFDLWVQYIFSKRKQLTAQFHDEIVLEIKEGFRERCEKLLRWAIDEVNNQLKLNVKLDIDVQFGNRYSDIH